MKTIFMGTPDFAVPCLKALAESTHEVMAVFTQPDKPKGRGYKMIPTPVKTAAAEYDIPVYQPEIRLREYPCIAFAEIQRCSSYQLGDPQRRKGNRNHLHADGRGT